jgi:hypothetical protein
LNSITPLFGQKPEKEGLNLEIQGAAELDEEFKSSLLPEWPDVKL